MKHGLKLWSTNHTFFYEARRLFKENRFHFLELYVVPESFNKISFKNLEGIPVTLHAPHDLHGLNLTEKNSINEKLIKETLLFADYFNTDIIVAHPGFGHEGDKLKNNCKKILDKRFLFENMPFRALESIGGGEMFGASYKQIAEMVDLGHNLCFDLCHAVKSALAQGMSYKDFITSIIKDFNPSYFHISDTNLDHIYDEHLNLGEGQIDLAWFKNIIEIQNKNDVYIVFETPKLGYNLENDIRNINYFFQLNKMSL